MSEAVGIIRPARRPEGWTAPGPLPCGDLTLLPRADEDLCYLAGDWRIFQKVEGNRFTLDDIVTSAFALRNTPGDAALRALDLGCGIGSVLLMNAWRLPRAALVGIEAQDVSHDLATRSIAYNGVGDRVSVVHGDLREAATPEMVGVFDLVTGTPPYFSDENQSRSERVQCGPCRFEDRGGVEQYALAASRVLKPGGRFVVVHAAWAEARVLAAIDASGLSATAVLSVVPREGRGPLLIVAEAVRAEAAGDVERVTMTVRDRDGRRTPEFGAMRAAMGMPP
jgi:tRNA1(Val) A37 N6-methylase TrmN6